MHITDMVMHVGESLEEQSRRNVERKLTGQCGILHAHFNEQRPHLLLVAYDTERTSSTEILAGMTLQSLNAERIG